MNDPAGMLTRLARSTFRAKFHLTKADADYARQRGRATIAFHARDLLTKRISAAHPVHDGRQTPYRGHPVFPAQHATATCCRGCVEKWYGIPKGRELTPQELDRLTAVVMAWIDRDLQRDAASRTGAPSRSVATSVSESVTASNRDSESASVDTQSAPRASAQERQRHV
ncbi:DUF4186 domain-containing protein [Pseudoclavibacter sp. CFCC 13796]|uniref:DUF4186 domain-containing protein n=1 Tax=Pseudoclavibacter sp. CFCC 13796 TaxID=2615179 RepID=UPI0013016091|nr:DUF4186 domain-containing protein [Pseudoclavibacter sp. CFCC 13796]KAB1659988.1 DUF4186 domain-containing protein [Pseudoclavibacter sp. CFCC 13796]